MTMDLPSAQRKNCTGSMERWYVRDWALQFSRYSGGKDIHFVLNTYYREILEPYSLMTATSYRQVNYFKSTKSKKSRIWGFLVIRATFLRAKQPHLTSEYHIRKYKLWNICFITENIRIYYSKIYHLLQKTSDWISNSEFIS